MKITQLNVSGPLSCEGSRLISAILKKAGHDVTNVFFARGGPIAYETSELDQLRPILDKTELALCAVYTRYALRAVQTTQFIHEHYPHLKVIWGGPHCIGSPETSLKYADGVCFSEGDECILDLVSRMEAGEDYLTTPNMAFSVNGAITQNAVLPAFRDLDGLPYSDFSLEGNFVLDRALSPLTREKFEQYSAYRLHGLTSFYTVTARGCPHHCTYCYNCRFISMFGKNIIRTQSVDRFMDELEHHLKHLAIYRQVIFGDDDFFVRPTAELERFAVRYKKTINLPLSFAISAATFRWEKMELMLDCGVKSFQIGVQSGSQRVLEEVYDRRISLDKIKGIFERMAPYYRSHGFRLTVDFIVDNPYETRDDINKTYHYILNVPDSARLNIFTLSFFPGTPLYDRALADGLIEPFNERTFRAYAGRIQFQRNYETFLIFFFRMLQLRRMRKLAPRFLLRFLGSRPVRAVMGVLPSGVHHVMIKAVRRLTPAAPED